MIFLKSSPWLEWNCFWGTSALTWNGGLFEVLLITQMQIEVLMKPQLCRICSICRIYSWDSTVNQLFFSTACLAWRRQRAARHLCFNFYDTQASGLWCTLAFCLESVWNLQTKHDEWWVVEAIVTGATVHCTMPAAQHVSGITTLIPLKHMRTAHGFLHKIY